MKTFTRREIGKLSGLTLLLACIVGPISFLTGCSTSTIAQAIIASFANVLKLLQSAGILTNPTLAAAAEAALTAFSNAYNAYEANKGAGTLAALEAAAQSALNSVQAFLTATNIGGPIAAVAIALLQIILSTLASFLPASAQKVSVQLEGKLVGIAPVSRTRAQFVTDFNAVCVQYGHKEARIK
jgi:methionyl-tRNA synthetase